MAIVVEDGSIVTGANSYVSEAELTTYATARGVTLTIDTEQLLIRAMDYIDSLQFKGVKLTDDQPLQWPRADVVIDAYLLSVTEIPEELKNALMQSAMAIDNGEDPLADIDKEVQSETVGPISVTYKTGSSSTTLVRKISSQLYKLLANGGGNGSSFIVNRG